MSIPANFSYTGEVLTYKYEIYDASGTKISGLLAGDKASDASGGSPTSTLWDTDSQIGGASTYSIRFYADLNDASGSVTTNLETLDVTLDFNTDYSGNAIFKNFSGASFDTSNSIFNVGLSTNVLTDEFGETDSIRFTGGVGGALIAGKSAFTSTGGYEELFRVTGVTLDSSAGEQLLDASGLGTIDMSASTNVYDTVISRTSTSNANIKSLDELGYATQTFVDETDRYNKVSLHEAESKLVDFGTTIYTQRNIGSSDKTALVRSGDVVKADAYWSNAGTYSEKLNNLLIANSNTTDLQLVDGNIGADRNTFSTKYFSDYVNNSESVNLKDASGVLDNSGSYLKGMEVDQSNIYGYDIDATDVGGVSLDLHVKVNASAGTVISNKDFYSVTGQQNGSGNIVDGSNVTTNLVTYAGDLNYDGRVSLKDLAFLNAGKLAEGTSGDFYDVDANYDGTISIADLAVLSNEWDQTIHTAGISTVYDSSGYSGGNITSSSAYYGKATWTTVSESHTENFLAYDASGGTSDSLDPFTTANLQDGVVFTNSSFDYQSGVDASGASLQVDTLVKSQLLTDSGTIV